jgi:hypothetical protein
MSMNWTDPNPEGINRTIRDLLNFQYGVSDTIRGVGTGLAGIANIPGQFFSGKTPSAPNFTPGFTPRPWQMTPPAGARNQQGTGPTLGPDGKPLIKTGAFTGRNTENDAPASDPYLDLLYGFMEQAGQGSGGANLSGYNASLKMLGKERKRMKARYKKYQNQISDIYGTLSGINKDMIASIAPTGEAMRADLAAQEGQQAAATRSADAARLAAATKARAELGLEDVASQYAGGDVATTQAEGMVKDSAANATAAQNTMLANEAIAKQQLTNQNLGRTIQEEGSTRQLQTSLEDALAAIRGERVNVLNQRAQAASQGSGPNIGMQMDILQKIQDYTNPQASGEPSALDVFKSRNPGLETTANQAADTFTDWISKNYNTIPSVRLGKKPDAREVVNTFIGQVGTTVPQAETWARNNNLYNLLIQLASPPTN